MALGKYDVFDNDQVPFIRYTGDYDWVGLYDLAREWIEKNNYRFQEKRYKHKGEEAEIELTGEKKIDVMYKYHIYIKFQMWDYKDYEKVIEGKKKKIAQGRIEISMQAQVEVDYSGRFKGGKFAEQLGKWWLKIVQKDTELIHIDGLTYKLLGFHAEVKKFLGMTTSSNAY